MGFTYRKEINVKSLQAKNEEWLWWVGFLAIPATIAFVVFAIWWIPMVFSVMASLPPVIIAALIVVFGLGLIAKEVTKK